MKSDVIPFLAALFVAGLALGLSGCGDPPPVADLPVATPTATATVAAAPLESEEQGPLGGTAPEEDFPEVRMYADAYGVSIDEARRRLEVQNSPEVGAVLSEIRRLYPDRHAAAWRQHVPSYRTILVFTGGEEGLDAARALIAPFPELFEIRLGAKHSIQDLLAATEVMRADLGEDARWVGTGIDEQSNAVNVYLNFDTPFSAAPAELAARLEAVSGVRVVVTAERMAGWPRPAGESQDTGPLAIYPGPWNALGAGAAGKLVRDGRCVYIESEGGLRVLLALASGGTRWDAATDTLYFLDEAFPVGTELWLGGHGTEPGQPFDGWLIPPDPSCDVTRIWFSGQPSSRPPSVQPIPAYSR